MSACQNVNFGLDPQAIATAVYYGATAAMATTAALQSQATGYTPGPKRKREGDCVAGLPTALRWLN